MSSLKHIAQKTGVSISTVSRILNGKAGESRISPDRVKEVNRIARKMGFRFNYAARATRLKNARHIGVLIRNVIDLPHYNPGAFEMIMGINARVAPEGYIVTVVRWSDRDGKMEDQSRLFREQALDAMLVIGSLSDTVRRQVEDLMPRCIWVESERFAAEGCIRRDEVYSGELAGRALGELGYSRWLYLNVTPPTGRHYSLRERLTGVERAARKYGAELSLFPNTNYLPADPNLLRDYLRPDVGIIAYNHMHARWCASVAADFRKIAPYDFGLVCCDETHELQHCWPQLSRVGCELMNIGRTAGEFALRMIRTPEESCPSRQIRGVWRPGSTAWGPQNQ